MNLNFSLVVKALADVALAGIVIFGLYSCSVEDHRHTEEMRRLSSECQE